MMGSSLYPDRLWISLVWILTIRLTAVGSSITWYEPPPIQTFSDTDLVDHLGNSTQLLEGSINASLSWNFSLSSDLSFSSLTVSLGGTTVAGVLPSGPGVQAGFEDKFDIRWIPFQRVTLIIFNVTTEVNGSFSCTVTAAKGFGTEIFDSKIQVHVVDPPSNIVTSRNITITAPDELTLNCSADGKPKPTRTWTRLSDNTVVTMPLNITGEQDAGGYRCTVDNGVGSALTKDVFITVLVRPKIDYLSSDWDVCESSTVILSCNATGEPTPNISWKRVADDEILPAVDGVYVIDSIKRNSSGRYCCKADNGVGIDSKTVNVTVRFAASIDGITNSSNTVNEGGFFNMTCQASDNPLPTNYTWINKDGLLFNENVLSFINISRAEAGEYRCEVENLCGKDGRNTYVNVYYPPNITSISLNQTVADEGDVVLLNCTADGNPEPDITWNRLSSNGTDVHVGPAETYLNIAGKQDEGGYRCIADNGIGNEDFSDVLNITVESYHPINTVLSTNLTNNTVNLNESFNLICNADANPAATYRLYTEQESLQEQSNGTYLTRVSTRTKQVPYTCIPFNDFGDGHSKTINVTVYYNPATVRLVANIAENRTCSDFLLVNFTCAASEANPPVEGYQLLKGQEIFDSSSNWTWIKNISKKDHIYSCRALHPLGNVTSSDLTVTFNVPIQVSVHVKSGRVTLAEGGSVSLKCNASGYPKPIVYTWTKLDADEFVVSGQWLNFTNISKEETGEYICNASNTCEEKPSSLTTIDVQYKPSEVIFGASPSENKNCADFLLVNFTCVASEANPPVKNYQLLKGQEIVNTSSKGTWIKNITKKGDHIYRCKVLHPLGNVTSVAVTVTFNVPVQVSVHVNSGSVTLGEGDSLSLECNASGYPQPTVTWSKLNAFDFIISSQWLNFTNISKEATGEYICNANNTCGEKPSSTTTIDVQYKPSNVILVANPTENVNCSDFLLVNFTCEAADANPPVENYQLLKSQEFVDTGSNGMWIKNITKKGGYFYSCRALHPLGNVTSPDVTVTFNVPVQISVHVNRGSETVMEGGNVSLNCDASAYPKPTVTWSKLNADEFIHVISSQWLNFTNISREATGKYICNANNTCGKKRSSVRIIDVQYAAEATGGGGYYSVSEGRSKLFSCPVDGNPEPNITWYKDNYVIGLESFTAISFFGRKISNAKELKANETGCYTCSANNSLGPPVTITHCLTVGGNCETNCTGGKGCLALGTKYFCRCPNGTTGENCGQKDTFTDEAEMGFEFTKEEFKPDYKKPEAPKTKEFILKVKQAIKTDMNDTGLIKELDVNLTPTVHQGERIVIANVKLKFSGSVGKGAIKELIDEALKDKKLGDLDVGRYKSDGFFSEEPTSDMPTSTGQPVKEGPPWTIIGAVAGSVVLVAFVVALVTWWVHKKRKCIKDTKIHNSECEESLHGDSPHAKVNRAYAESGPPSASGTEGAARQQSQDLGAIPTYAVVDKSKKKKKKEEKPPIYASVDKSKKRKKKTDDKNLYDNVEEPKKEKKPGEVLYAELGDFQNPAMPEVSTSPATLPPLKRPPSYEQTQYADITAFLKGDATLPQKEGNEGSEMQQQSANQSQHDVDNKETPM